MDTDIAFYSSNGFCYVANTGAYIQEAMKSIASLKSVMPSAHVCMISPKELWDMQSILIDDWRELRLSDRTPIVKNDATLAPYERVAFVDTDTRFVAPMEDVFGLLDSFDIAAAHEPTRGWDYPSCAPHAFCELNTGFLVFRNNSKIREFFDLWLEEYRKLMVESNLRNDQPSFRSALWKSTAIRIATLPSEYHCISGKPVAIAWEARLLHDRDCSDKIAAEINLQLGYRAYLPGLGNFKPFSGRKGWILQWVRLSIRWLSVLIKPSQLRNVAAKPHQWHLGETGKGQKEYQ